MLNESLYVTSDLYLTAYLKIKGFKFKTEQKKSKSDFIFESSPELLSSVNEYLSEMGTCDPLVFTNAIKNLKNYLYNNK
jgi:hypothetical protein